MRPISVVSSENFRSLTEGSLDVQSFLQREKSSGERTQPWGALVLIVRVLDENFPCLTSCCLSVRKLLIHWQMEEGTESRISLFWRKLKKVKSGAEVYKQDPHIRSWFIKMLQDEVQSHVDCIIHRPLLHRQTTGGPVSVQWCPSNKPKPVFQIISWPEILEPQVCSH